MLQAIGEGMALLRRHRGVRVVETLACWQHGSVIRSWLIDLMHGQYVKTRDFVTNRTPSGISSEKLAPRPSVTSIVSSVCCQNSNWSFAM